jgi:hypothetical protein
MKQLPCSGPKILDATVQNLVARAIGHAGFVHAWLYPLVEYGQYVFII